ncbi:MAG: hypothetical protein KAS38_16840 [Anaerolineales bacterium]|nr:hypothetical protein [Anaerolineales bacterium]
MTTQTTSYFTLETKSFLQRALLGNAAFSGISGLFMVLAAGPISQFFGLDNPLFLTIIGILLLLYMPFLVWLANQSPVPNWMAWVVIELDVLWVIGSLILIFTSLVPLTTSGKWAVAITADIVTVFAILQYIGLRRQQRIENE